MLLIIMIVIFFVVVNVGLGIALFQSDCLELTGRGNHILWVYLTWLAFVLVFQVSLFCTFTYISLKVRDSGLLVCSLFITHPCN